MRKRVLPVLVAVLLLGALAACTGGGDPATQSAASARSFLDAWAKGDNARAGGMTSNGARATAALRAATVGLNASAVSFATGTATVKDSSAKVPFTAHWTIRGVSRPWTYAGELPLDKTKSGTWQVSWSPADIHPKLRKDQTLVATRSLPPRAPILDDQGHPLFTAVPVVEVGIEPRTVTDLPHLADLLARTVHVDAAQIESAVKQAKPTAFVSVITLRRSDYLKVRSQIHDVPGTVFHTGVEQLAPTAQFAKLLLGRVGPASAEVLKALGPGYLPTDDLGTSGLQAAYNKQLAGSAGAKIQAVSTHGGDVAPGSTTVNPDATTIGTVPARPGTPVKSTLDVSVQNAADAALATVGKHASIVAIRPSTGAILAVANSPSTTFDIAMQGQYPAGSTFKIITASSLLEHHTVAADASVPCPGQTTVFGKTFHNENSFDLGTVSLQTAFAHSCNTSFTMLSQKLGQADLPTTAKQFGIGAGWSLPVTSFSGSLPAPRDDTERAADAIGQGRVLVSPFAMALVAATTAHGSTPAPVLVTGRGDTPAHRPTVPPASVLAQLKPFMRAVVTSGTATGVDGVPGGPVYGKTGTAEYGTAVPPHSHAWFVGYQGDLAFAVFVEGGESSSTTAVPIANTFLRALH
ncbi:MAG TPA: penicillin-binding transpeptidase domain-containing protein [Mycobacteriales bacterium]